jgi:predicted amidophosphoribosyltransferase
MKHAVVRECPAKAELIARGVAKRINASVLDKLKVVRRSRDQVELSDKAGRANVADAYVSRGSVTGRVLLVDDVGTTGSTLSECAVVSMVSKRAGAGEVQALTLCMTCWRLVTAYQPKSWLVKELLIDNR